MFKYLLPNGNEYLIKTHAKTDSLSNQDVSSSQLMPHLGFYLQHMHDF